MAQPLNLLTSFVDGQGAGASNYVTYAEDLDQNFSDIQTTVNQLVQEVNATLSQNALLPLDILRINDPNTPLTGGTEDQGVIGEHSYEVSINGGDTTQLLVEAGQVLVNSKRQQLDSQQTLVGSGSSGTRWVAVDTNGALFLETAAAQRQLDIASVNWDGAQFTGAVTQLAPIFFDGDDYGQQLRREAQGTGPVFPAKDFRTAAARLVALERILAGETTDGQGDALGDVELAGLAAATAGSASSPWAYREGDPDTGVFFPVADAAALAAGGVEGMRVAEAAGIAQVLLSTLGTASAPSWAFVGDADTGAHRPGADRLAFSTGGTDVLELTAEQHIDSPTQPRADFRRNAVQSVTSATLTPLSFDTEVTDVGAWGAATTATLTVPTGGDGFYAIVGGAFFDESSSTGPNTNERQLAITLNGAGLFLASGFGRARVPAAALGDTYLSVAAHLALAAGDVLRLEVAQDSGGAMDVTGRLSVVKLW